MGVVGLAASSSAAPITYNINFTGGSPTPSSGSFGYDSATQTFNFFTVVRNSFSYDLTGQANAPNLVGSCDTLSPNATDTFAWLQSGGCRPQIWTAVQSFGSQQFMFGSLLFDLPNDIRLIQTRSASSSTTFVTNGNFTIAPAAVPEPSSTALMLAGGAALVWRRRLNTQSPKTIPTQQ